MLRDRLLFSPAAIATQLRLGPYCTHAAGVDLAGLIPRVKPLGRQKLQVLVVQFTMSGDRLGIPASRQPRDSIGASGLSSAVTGASLTAPCATCMHVKVVFMLHQHFSMCALCQGSIMSVVVKTLCHTMSPSLVL